MFRGYGCPNAVGWLGYFVDADGDVTAFVGLDKRVFFVSEFSGWNAEPDDPSDWWKGAGA